jgi:two-component system cell cycle response regulator DivK
MRLLVSSQPVLDPASALIVDKDADSRALFMEWLRVWGYQPTSVATAREALEAARSLPPAIITTGLGFPDEEDGCWLCEQLKSDPLTKDIPVIVITAWAMGGHLERARRAGADAVLTKPCSASALHAEVQRLASLKRTPLAM